eukprot:scaffold79432_cov95-Phaeocystis_antarctica.AAC.1
MRPQGAAPHSVKQTAHKTHSHSHTARGCRVLTRADARCRSRLPGPRSARRAGRMPCTNSPANQTQRPRSSR